MPTGTVLVEYTTYISKSTFRKSIVLLLFRGSKSLKPASAPLRVIRS